MLQSRPQIKLYQFQRASMQLQYKYVVNGVWRYDPWAPVVRDEDGNLNNVLEVRRQDPPPHTHPFFGFSSESGTRPGFEPNIMYLSHPHLPRFD